MWTPRIRTLLAALVPLATAALYLRLMAPAAISLFPMPEPSLQDVGRFIADNTTADDLVIGLKFRIDTGPPAPLFYSHKRVHLWTSTRDVCNMVRRLPDDSEVSMLLLANPRQEDPSILPRIRDMARQVVVSRLIWLDSGYTDSPRLVRFLLCKIKKQAFLNRFGP